MIQSRRRLSWGFTLLFAKISVDLRSFDSSILTFNFCIFHFAMLILLKPKEGHRTDGAAGARMQQPANSRFLEVREDHFP